jgi:hypothetical protein
MTKVIHSDFLIDAESMTSAFSAIDKALALVVLKLFFTVESVSHWVYLSSEV